MPVSSRIDLDHMANFRLTYVAIPQGGRLSFRFGLEARVELESFDCRERTGSEWRFKLPDRDPISSGAEIGIHRRYLSGKASLNTGKGLASVQSRCESSRVKGDNRFSLFKKCCLHLCRVA